MKKFFTLFLTLMTSVILWAYDFQSGDLYYNITSNVAPYTVEVTSGNTKYSGDITIPSSVTYNGITYAVTSIRGWAFEGCSSLTSVTIPNSVTSIGNYAFRDCFSLTSITIPSSVTHIGSGAFEDTGIFNDNSNWENEVLYISNCLVDAKESLSGVYTIKDGTRIIADYAFSGCSSLTSVTIPIGVTSIGHDAFRYCFSLTSITIPSSVTSIGSSAFSYCSSLTAIIVEGYNTVYDSRENCNAIIETATNTLIAGCQSTTIPNSVTSIGSDAFYCCLSLTSVTIPTSVTSIGNNAFTGCSSLTSVAIPNSVTSIGTQAFSGCSSLTSVTIPNSVTSIEDWTFIDCSSLTSVTFGYNTMVMIDEDAFENCYNLDTIYDNTDLMEFTIGSGEHGGVAKNASYIIKDSSPDAFIFEGTGDNVYLVACTQGYPNFPSTDPYGNPYTIGSHVMRQYSLSYQEGWQTEYRYDNYGNRTTIYYDDLDLDYVDFPSTLKGLAPYAFEGTNIRNVDLHDTKITSIPEHAFSNCHNIESITLPNTLTSIGNNAFSGCSSLTSVTIPNSVTSIGDQAFMSCSSLTSVTIPNSVTRIEDWTFRDCSSLTSVTIPNSVTSIGDSAFYHCSSLTSITIPSSVTSIGMCAFRDCSSLTSISIPNSVIHIEEASLAGCPSLSRIIIENGNPVYDSRNNCNAIVETATNTLIAGCKNTIIPNTITTIGRSAFWYCSTLTSITIPNSVKTIGVRAFVFCPSLTSIKIPKSVTKIEGAILTGCNSATSIVVEEGNPNYDSRDNCNAIIETGTNTLLVGCQNTVIPKSITTIKEYAFAYSTYPSIASNATTPPIIDGNTFFSRETPITVYVPCGTKAAYEAAYEASYWAEYVGEFVENDEFHFDFKVSSADESMGNAVITQEPGCETAAIIAATPNDGYFFSQWSDGNTDNPRTLTVTEDMELTAEFEQNNGSYSRNVRIGYNTICLPHGSSHFTGATFYEIAHILKNKKKIFFDEVKTLEAGKPYIFYPHSNEVTIYYDNTTSAVPLSHNGLHGTFDGITAASNLLKGKYLVAGNRMVLCGDGCSLAANRAYIELDEISDKDSPAIPGIKRVSMDYSEENATTALDNITDESIVAPIQEGVYDILGRKVDAPTVSGFYIINGKKVFVAR